MKKIISMALAATLVGAATAPASAVNFTNVSPVCVFHTSMDICMSFNLAPYVGPGAVANEWQLTATLDSDYAGLIKALGLFANPEFTPYPVFTGSTPAGWSSGDFGLSGPFTASVFEVGAGDSPGVAGPVSIRFTSVELASYTGTVYARAHVGSIEGDIDQSCSMKFGSAGEVVGTENCFDDGGGDTDVVPEPISLVLLGSGLLGIGGVRVRRRKK